MTKEELSSLAAGAAGYLDKTVFHAAKRCGNVRDCRSREDRNGEILTYHLRAGAAGAAVARHVTDNTLYVNRYEILRSTHVVNTLYRELRVENRSLVHA